MVCIVYAFQVLVTNLHRCVTVADMEELFGTIGQIMSARLLKEGVAEAMFVNKEDAIRYHMHFDLPQGKECIFIISKGGEIFLDENVFTSRGNCIIFVVSEDRCSIITSVVCKDD